MIPLFKALIRPILEYGNAVWCPHLRKHIDHIESVQRYFTRCIIETKNKTYEERLKLLNLPSLEFRRLRGDMIETYKICNKIYDPATTTDLFIPNTDDRTRSNGQKLSKSTTEHNQYLYFFTNRIINIWNKLPSQTANSKSTNEFKNNIDIILNDYKYSTNITEIDI